MRIQDGPLGHLRDVVDQRNAQFMAEIAAAASIRSAKTRPTTRAVASAPASTPKVQASTPAHSSTHVNAVA
ncbi:MAG: hypothetical protein EBS89_04910 [Proteobacteria bacterium]|jgi:hypothetical protein|nr:hypothetical protein [Pseudomonadota bacterium]